MLLYGLWLLAFFGPGHDPRDAALIGRHWVQQSHASSVITLDPTYPYAAGERGYDGEFVYFIALDPLHARFYTDAPSYRYTRIVYPLLARVVAAGRPSLVPYALLLINWLAIGGGTLALAAWLRRKGQSAWFALAYGFYPGLFVSLQRDTTEALAYGLVALGVFLWDGGGRCRLLWAATIFSLAALTRETTVLFPIAYGLGALLTSAPDGAGRNHRLRQAAVLIGASLLPLLAYKLLLIAWLGRAYDPGLLLEAIPFAGFVASRQAADWLIELGVILLPAIICLAAAILMLRKQRRSVAAWLLVANVVLFVVLLHRSSLVDLYSSTRVTTGIVLAAALCLPAAATLLGNRLWFIASAVGWLALVPAWLLLPEFRYLAELTRPLRHSR